MRLNPHIAGNMFMNECLCRASAPSWRVNNYPGKEKNSVAPWPSAVTAGASVVCCPGAPGLGVTDLLVCCSNESRPQASESGEGRHCESDAAALHDTGEQRGATAGVHTQLRPTSKGAVGPLLSRRCDVETARVSNMSRGEE